ncbi:MAG TPA: glycine--tRNA ligase subunit beta [Acetobacteraceae bacterium]|nr:glycine--tRNA ligase subunit beta [Acetobacteraceae bacterium]
MPEFFCEFFSEEIPARMQARAAEELSRLIGEALAPLSPRAARTFFGPRRIAYAAELNAEAVSVGSVERGPRVTAPEQALAGFLRKHGATRDLLRQEGDFWVLEKPGSSQGAAALIAASLPALVRRFPWPKSMRWGGTSGLTWVRPLRRICCLFDGAVVPVAMGTAEDDGHGLTAGDASEGHRFLAPDAFTVSGAAQWQDALRDRYVIADAAERAASIVRQIGACAAAADVEIVEDAGLTSEVAGLVEWPVVLRGRIDDAFMDLPPEVMQVSMRVNQRYFATCGRDGKAAPYFVFVANVTAPDGGAAIVAGNERVLRARFADARHFWDLDRRTKLADRVAALDGVVFHALLGTQGARARRLEQLAARLAPFVDADGELAARAALLAKADLTTGMVGEFPELQGVMGGYYARHDGEADAVAEAVRDHYAPRGPGDGVPTAPVSVAVALADKIDQLAGFFAAGERPTGSGDPFALRRAALGVIRIVRENGLRIGLRDVLRAAAAPFADDRAAAVAADVLAFIADRLRVQLRGEGARHDVLAAVFAAGADDDLTRLLARSNAVAGLLGTENGTNLLAAYKRATNILRIEDRKDGPHGGAVDVQGLQAPEEIALHAALAESTVSRSLLLAERFEDAMRALAGLRMPLDAFFDKVTVNADEVGLRLNRLRLLAGVRAAMNEVADFSQIESGSGA